jgi:hypothetical protein
MDHLELFRGNYEARRNELEQQRNELIEQVRGFIPDNYLDLVDASEEGSAEHELNWVKVPDPGSDDPTPALEVLPVLGLWRGENEYESTTPTPPGLSSMALVGKLPDGEKRIIGNIGAMSSTGRLLLWLNKTANGSAEVGGADWESADAELFLKLAKSALDSQGSTG